MADLVPSVAVATGFSVVTGTATSFVAAEGDLFILNGITVPILMRDSATKLTLASSWPGPTATAATGFKIAHVGPYWQSTVATNEQLAELLEKFEAGNVRWDDAGPFSGRSAHDAQKRGFAYLATDPAPLRLYVKNSATVGDWSAGQLLQLKADSTAEASAARDAAAGSAAAAGLSEINAALHESTALGALTSVQGLVAQIADLAAKSIATLASAKATVIPAIIGAVVLNGYAAVADGPPVRYKRVTAEPTSTLKFRSGDRYLPDQSSSPTNGGWWVCDEAIITPRMGGARMDGTDETAALDRAWGHVKSFMTGAAVGAPSAPVGMPGFMFDGRIRAPGYKIEFEATGVSIWGTGTTTVLDGIEIHARGSRYSLRDFVMVDSRGIVAGTRGLRLGSPLSGVARYTSLISGIYCRDRAIGLEANNYGAFDNLANCVFERNGINFRNTYSEGMHITNTEFLNPDTINIDLPVGNEVKFQNSRALGGTPNCRIRGTTLLPWLEGYLRGLTLTVAPRSGRQMTILSAADNGSGGTRFTTSATRSVTGITGVGAILSRGTTADPAEAYVTFVGGGAGAQITSVAVGGTNLLSGPVAWDTSLAKTVTAAAANISAGAHGYKATAPQNNGRLFLYGPAADGAAANGRVVTVAASGFSNLFLNSFVQVTTAEAHGYVAGQDVELACGANFTGIAEIAAVPSATTFMIEAPAAASATGSVWVPNRLTVNINELRITGSTGYDGTYVITACTATTFDIARAFTATTTGTADLPGWDLIIETEGQTPRTSDIFIGECNINYMLVRSAYRVELNDVRNKTQLWVDQRLSSLYRTNRLIRIGGRRGLGILSNFSDCPISGAASGWGQMGYGDDSGSYIPGNGYMDLMVPHRATGIANGLPTNLNGFRATETGAEVRAGGQAYAFTSTGVNWGSLVSLALPGGHTAQGPADAVNKIQLISTPSGNRARLAAVGDAGLQIEGPASTSLDFYLGGYRQGRITYTANTVSYPFLTGAAAGGTPIIGVSSTEASADLLLSAAGSAGAIRFNHPVAHVRKTFGGLPAASASAWQEIVVSDRNGRSARSDGANWRWEDGTIAA